VMFVLRILSMKKCAFVQHSMRAVKWVVECFVGFNEKIIIKIMQITLRVSKRDILAVVGCCFVFLQHNPYSERRNQRNMSVVVKAQTVFL